MRMAGIGLCMAHGVLLVVFGVFFFMAEKYGPGVISRMVLVLALHFTASGPLSLFSNIERGLSQKVSKNQLNLWILNKLELFSQFFAPF